MRWGGQARRNFPRGCYRRSYEGGLPRSRQLVSQCSWGAAALLTHLLANPHLEQGSLSWAEPQLQSLPCYSRSHGGRTTSLSHNPHGWGPSLWVVLESPFPWGPDHILGPLGQDTQHTATTGLLCARPWAVSRGFSKNEFTHALT